MLKKSFRTVRGLLCWAIISGTQAVSYDLRAQEARSLNELPPTFSGLDYLRTPQEIETAAAGN